MTLAVCLSPHSTFQKEGKGRKEKCGQKGKGMGWREGRKVAEKGRELWRREALLKQKFATVPLVR